MLVSELLTGLTWSGELPDREVLGLTADSRQLEPGWVFVCQKGLRFDGHDFAARAVELGAAAVVTDRDLGCRGRSWWRIPTWPTRCSAPTTSAARRRR